MNSEALARAMEQLRRGRPIIIYDDMERESEGDLAFAAQVCTPEVVNFALTVGRGLLCVSMSQQRAGRLGIPRLKSNGNDPLGTPFGMPVSLANGSSGISAKERCKTILALDNPDTNPSALSMPGHVSTLIAHEAGLVGRCGHTEAILEILSLAGIPGCGVLCEILNPDGTVARLGSLQGISKLYDLPMLDIGELLRLCRG